MLSSVLIANRGEIACRIARTARQLGMRVIAVYSDADRDALHVSLADEAHRLGPADAKRKLSRCRANHRDRAAKPRLPAFTRAMAFFRRIPNLPKRSRRRGSSLSDRRPSAIRAMGLKDAAKRLMAKAGVPVVPGYDGAEQDAAFLAARAAEIGYPVMIKAVAGGGGKGMRHVAGAAEFASALEACRREAASAFGNDRVLIEKFIARPRHIEIQVLADGAWQLRLALRARLFLAAPPSEGHRGIAGARHDGSACAPAWARRRSPAPRRSAIAAPARWNSSLAAAEARDGAVLFHGDEHAGSRSSIRSPKW